MAPQSKIEIILAAVDRGLTTGFNRAIGTVKSFVAGTREAETGVKGLTGAVSGLLAPLLATVSAAAGMQKLVAVSREFDKLSAGLLTATGSADGADQSFTAIQDFATKTPYDLAQVTDSFIKLVNFGLDPSERALTSYGNTSSALGKDLNQMIEAVADAATGEFERLKEFGIKASSEGDKVSFTFRGVTTTVGKNAKEIEDYLIKLGETNFGDAMANRMQTLDGALSNLQDEWDKVFLNISQAGIGNLIADGVRVGIGALEELNAMIKSGELEGNLRSIAGQFAGWGEDIKAAIAIVRQEFTDFTSGLDTDGKTVVEELINAFRRFPENVRAFIGLMTVEVAAGFDKAIAYAQAARVSLAAAFSDAYSVGDAAAELKQELAVIDGARNASIDSILKERDATVKAAADKRTAAKLERVAWEEKKAAEKATTTDRLAQFKIQGDTATASAKAEGKAKREAAAAAKKAAAEAKREYEEQKKIAAEKMRAASQEKILALELEKLEASKLPTALARAEAELAIDRRMMAERVSLKKQELAAMQEDARRPDSNTSQADIIRAESDLANMRLEVSRQELAGQKEIASERLAAIEDSWRQSAAGVEEYKAAVTAAYQLGLMETREYNERMIAAGNDLGAGLQLGFQRAMEQMRTDAEIMIEIGEQVPDRLAAGLANVFTAATEGADAAKDAVIDWARSTINWISQVILKQMILNAMQSVGLGMSAGGQAVQAFALGGPVQALAGGGPVRGWSPSPTADNIPAWLTAREFVHPVDAVDWYGLPFMEMVRRKLFPRNLARALAGHTLPRIPSGNRLAAGGVAAAAPATTVKTGDVRLAVVNVNDESLVKNYIKSADFDTVLINKIRRNGSAIRTLLR